MKTGAVLVAAMGALLALAAPACAQDAGQVVPIEPMRSPRAAHTSTPLPDGRVLLAGGCTAQGCEEGTGSAELFDPETRRFTATGAMTAARIGHLAVRQRSGGVLLIGGWTATGATASIERYDPDTGTFSAFGSLLTPRAGFTATVLRDGRILVAGGYTGGMRRLDSAEIFDPRTRRSAATGSLDGPRMSHTATRLADGRVAIVGGTSASATLLDSIEIFDAATGRFSPGGKVRKARHKHAAALLASGEVLVLGGASAEDFAGQFSDTELYSPATGEARPGPAMAAARFKFTDTVRRLDDGSVLVGGDGRFAELFDPAQPRFVRIQGVLPELSFASLSLLPDGRALITGGYDDRLDVSRTAWLYDPET